MKPEIAKLLLPLARDLLKKGPDAYLQGAMVGACDVLESCDQIDIEEFQHLTELTYKNDQALVTELEKIAKPKPFFIACPMVRPWKVRRTS